MSKLSMKKFRVMIGLAIGVSLGSCQKQQSDEERRAEVNRQVQERLAAEHQQQQAQDLAQRQAELSAREQALKDKQDAAAQATPPPALATEQPVAREEPNEREIGGSYEMFYNKLEPYGDWIETNEYGYVYRPREAENARWRPYTNGHWVYTEEGWTWISEEPFGWATYHYGRWTRIRGAGWVWVPGNEWAPAWVSWRKGGDYVGWAPLPPEAHFDHASGIRNWSDNYYDVGPDQYVFVSTPDFGAERVESVVVAPQQNVAIVNQTTNVTNITYNNTVVVNQGPSYDELRARSKVPIQKLRLQRQATVPGENARAVVRGDIVTVAAPVIAPARAPERPRTVKQTITQTSADRGWAAVANQPAAEQARAKMKAESTPPPTAPAKKFVKPATASAVAGTPNAPRTASPTRQVAPPLPAQSSTAPAITSPPTKPAAPPPHLTPLPSTNAQPTVALPSASAPPHNRPLGQSAHPLPTIAPAISPLPPGAPQTPESSPSSPNASSPALPGEANEHRREQKPGRMPRRPNLGQPATSPSLTPVP